MVCVLPAIVLATMCAMPGDIDIDNARAAVQTLVDAGAPISEIAAAIDTRQNAEEVAFAGAGGIDVQLTAAGEPYRAEFRARRTGASARWGVPSPEQRTLAAAAHKRMNQLASAVWTLSISGSDRDSRRRRATAAGLRGAAMLGALRERATNDGWANETADARAMLDESIDLAQSPRGAILLAAAIIAAARGDLDRARTLLNQARSDPEGIDALEFELIEAAFEEGGITGTHRLTAANTVSERALSPSERLFLAEWRLRAAQEAGRKKSSSLKAVASLLEAASPNDRRILARPFADLAARAAGSDPSHPLEAFGQARRAVASGDLPAARVAFTMAARGDLPFLRTEILLELAQLELKEDNAPAALVALLAAIETEPTHASANAAGSLAARLSTTTGDRLATRNRLLAALPNHTDRYSWRLVVASHAYDNHDVPAAIELWESIPAIAPESITARARRLDAALQMPQGAWTSKDQPLRLVEAYDEAAAAHPSAENDARGIVLRVQTLLAIRRGPEASRLAETLLDIEAIPSALRPAAVAAALEAFTASKRHNQARSIVETFARVDPDGQRAFAQLMLKRGASSVRRLVARGEFNDARDKARRLVANGAIPDDETLRATADSEPWTAIQAALVLRLAGRPAKALSAVNLVLKAHPDAAEALLEKAMVLASMSDTGSRTEAFSLFKRLRAGAEHGSPVWWRCELGQLEMLEVLGKNLDAIRPRIARLREKNPDLGGPATLRGFEDLQARVNR